MKEYLTIKPTWEYIKNAYRFSTRKNKIKYDCTIRNLKLSMHKKSMKYRKVLVAEGEGLTFVRVSTDEGHPRRECSSQPGSCPINNCDAFLCLRKDAPDACCLLMVWWWWWWSCQGELVALHGALYSSAFLLVG